MQVDSINSSYRYPFEIVDEYGNTAWSPEYNDQTINQEDIDRFEKTVDRVEQNVHPTTILAGAVVMYTAFKRGKNILSSVEKAGTFAGEYIAKAATKLASLASVGLNKLSGKISKLKNITPIKYEAISPKIESFFDNLRAKSGVENNAITEKFPERLKEIFGEKTGNRVKAFMKSNNIKNTKDIVNAGIATAFGVAATDIATDKVESAQDRHEIKNAFRHLVRQAVEIDKVVANDSLLDAIENAVA